MKTRISKKAVSALLAITLLALTACGPSGQGSGDGSKSKGPTGGGSGTGSNVAGTYSVTFDTQTISGNVRHTGYVSSAGGQEKNILELKEDGTYLYTKLLTTDMALLASATTATVTAPKSAPAPAMPAGAKRAPADPAVASDGALFSWSPNNEGENKGSCTLAFYPDGTYIFEFPSYGLKENGTWTWSGWKMTVTKPSGAELAVEMDGDHALYFDYISDANASLHQNFIAPSSAWGAALGQTGSYTPTASAPGGETEGLSVSHYFTGKTTRKTAEGNDYEVNVHIFLLSDGTAYIAEANDNNTAITLGTWKEEGGSVTVSDGTNTVSASGAELTWNGASTAKSDSIPADYANADWSAKLDEAKKPAATGPVVLIYTFSGTYTADGNTVTLAPATSCTWSEDWGAYQNHGFVNGSGGLNDKVWPKGESDKYFLAADHFGGPYVIAPSHPAAELSADVVNNVAVKVEIDSANGSFTYVIESAFD